MDKPEVDIIELSKLIFRENCKQPHSIQLSLYEDDSNIQDIFKLLLIMFTEGMKIKYGKYDTIKKIDIVNLEDLDDKQFNSIKEYFNSFGFDCYYKCKTIKEYEEEETIKIDTIVDDLKNTTNSNENKNIEITDFQPKSFEEAYPVEKNTKLNELIYKIKCDNFAYSISFDFLKL